MTQIAQSQVEQSIDAELARGLAQQREELAFAGGSLPVLIAYVGADHRYVFANQAYERWFQRPPEQIVGRHVRDVLGRPAYAAVRPNVERALAGETVMYESVLPYRDGGARSVRVQLFPHRSPAGDVLGIFSLVEDLSVAGLFTSLLDSLPDGVILVNPDGVIVACNPSAERMVGRSVASLIGSPSALLFDPARALPKGTLHLLYPVFDVLRSDGTRAWLSVMTEPLGRADEAERYGTLLCLSDLTERKLAEESFAEAVSMRDLIAEASNDAIWDWDLLSNRIWWSEGLRAGFGHISESATDRTWWVNNIHPDDRELVQASWLAVFKGKSYVWLREFRFRTAEGSFASVICRGHIVRAKDGRPLRMFGAMQDVSRQRRVEDALEQSEELSRVVLSSLSARIGVLDREGIIIEVNDDWRSFERDDRSSDETPCLVGADYAAEGAGLRSAGEEFAGNAQLGIRAVLSGARRQVDLEYRIDTPRGPRWFAMHVEPLRTDRGGAVVSHVDTTMRRVADDAEIRRLAAEQSEQAKTDLINVVSHELRTPLAVIRGHVTTVLEYDDRMSELRRRKSLEAVDAAARQLERLVADLLTMGRIEAGVMRLECHPYSLDDVIGEAVEDVEAIARQAIEVTLPDEPLMIEIDRSRIIQVLYNLLDNAIKYGSDDSPIRIEARNAGPNKLLIVVESGGSGVGADEVDNIFERFYRTGHGKQVNARGAGLGLSISKGIVEAHHGRIWARTRKGAFQVHLSLPRIYVEAKATRPRVRGT